MVSAARSAWVPHAILAAGLANYILAASPPRYLFLVGVVPALLVFWIRRAVPEPAEWAHAKQEAAREVPSISTLFHGAIRSTTLWVILACGVSLTAHWAFMFWHQQHLRNLPDVVGWSPEQKNKLATTAMYLVIGSSILGNFAAARLITRYGARLETMADYRAVMDDFRTIPN